MAANRNHSALSMGFCAVCKVALPLLPRRQRAWGAPGNMNAAKTCGARCARIRKTQLQKQRRAEARV